jgi:carbamoyltransferase
MLVVGLSGGLNWAASERFQETSNFLHDAAAVVVRDGQVVAALEEERDNRLKHTNKFPIGAVRHGLREAGVTPAEVDCWAYCFGNVLEILATNAFMADMAAPPLVFSEAILADRLSTGLGVPIAPAKIATVGHHAAHVASAFEPSGFDSALVVSYDGGGDDSHGEIVSIVDGAYERLSVLDAPQSLGLFYHYAMRPIGYGRFDEYKVMGLAPYGDAARFRDPFRRLYTLHEGGKYEIHFERFKSLLGLVPVRRPGEPFTPAHMDLAAAIQDALETMAFHLIDGARRSTGHRNLCLAGGVALNCTFNGRLARANWFDEIFVQPASTDAGAALGAALYVERTASPRPGRSPLTHVYFGRTADCDSLEETLAAWTGVLDFTKRADICADAAAKLSEGAVIGWVQGRSEFGPRALGNRSIIADARPAANKDRVNLMVKKREAYRPFAPSVLAEHADEYFELPAYPRRFGFMSFAVPVQPDKRDLLQATTHVDGSSRVQVVYRDVNPRYWQLIDAFRQRTGVAVVLNTSFNNNAEPIVDSAEDAIQCYLTTGLDYLVIGDYLIAKTPEAGRVHDWMVVTQAPTAQLIRRGSAADGGGLYALRRTIADSRATDISAEAYALLSRADGSASIGQLLGAPLDAALAGELMDLWQKRLIGVSPGGRSAAARAMSKTV